MKKLYMKTDYRNFAKRGEYWETDDDKAAELVKLGRAEYAETDVEGAAPKDKEVKSKSRKQGAICEECGRSFTHRGLSIHKTRSHS